MKVLKKDKSISSSKNEITHCSIDQTQDSFSKNIWSQAPKELNPLVGRTRGSVVDTLVKREQPMEIPIISVNSKIFSQDASIFRSADVYRPKPEKARFQSNMRTSPPREEKTFHIRKVKQQGELLK